MSLEHDGVEVLQCFVSDDIVIGIKEEVNHYDSFLPKYGIRSADKKFSTISKLMNSQLLVDKATEILGKKPQVVRVIYFDKTEESNWLVPWHQDRTIALNKKVDVEGWGKWTIKDGVHHAQPSLDVLEKMITFRVHLDDSNRDNGCLKVILKSHKLGLLDSQNIKDIVTKEDIVLCEVKEGDILIMRPHILHASSKCKEPKNRCVVHIEYSSYDLPYGLVWA